MIKTYIKQILGKIWESSFYWIAKRTTGWKLYHSKKLNLTFLLNVNNFVDFMIYKYGVFEQDVLISITKQINVHEQVLFVDVGAHIGQMSLYVAKHFPNVVVMAFEPEPYTYIQHKAQQVVNNLEYQLYELAAGLIYGEKQLYLPKESFFEDYGKYNNGMATLHPNDALYITTPNKVKTVPLADFISNEINIDAYDKIIFKVDVEGAEVDVIKGLLPLLQTQKKLFIIMELLLTENRAECIEASEILNSVGFKLYTLNLDSISEKELKALPNGNYLFTNT